VVARSHKNWTSSSGARENTWWSSIKAYILTWLETGLAWHDMASIKRSNRQMVLHGMAWHGMAWQARKLDWTGMEWHPYLPWLQRDTGKFLSGGAQF
jgi:hypothetical protein